MNTWTVNTHRLKPRVEDDDNFTVASWRRRGSRKAARLHAIGQPELARSILLASFEKQLRLIGIRDVHLPRLASRRTS